MLEGGCRVRFQRLDRLRSNACAEVLNTLQIAHKNSKLALMNTRLTVAILMLGFGLPPDPCIADSGFFDNRETSLLHYAGTYDATGLLTEPVVETALESLLGGDLNHFRRNLEVRGSIDLLAGILSVSGNASHAGGSEEAVLCVATLNGEVSAAIFTAGIITVYSNHSKYVLQNLCIKDWITQVNSGHRDRFVQPENVRLGKTP